LHPLDDVIYLLCNESEIRSLSIHDKTDRLVVETGPISTISLSDDGTLLLLGYTCPRQEIACFDIEQRKMYPRCSGLKQKRFILRPGFVGAQSEFIVSGSEDASIYVWKRSDSELLAIGKGHMSVVNAIKRCPKDPNVFASASDDETVRIWRIT
jgi:WD40 repeat protein